MDGVPSPDDHLRVTILVRQVGPRSPAVFNRIYERLVRQRTIQVSDNPRRFFHANFVTHVNQDLLKFSELHIHYRIFGLIGVACASTSHSAPSHSSKQPDSGTNSVPAPADDVTRLHPIGQRRRSSLSSGSTMDEVKANYERLKSDHASSLVDSRCILVGYDESDCSAHFSSREAVSFDSLEDSDDLEMGIRDFMRSIYFVLESKRLDISFEKLDPPPCPVIVEEEKFRIGLENKTSKTYKRKCIGRSRKQHADFAMLTGLPQLALDAYQAAIEMLKASNDQLWLAGANEGWACAAMALRFESTSADRELGGGGMPRVASMTPQQMRAAQADRVNGSAAANSSPSLTVSSSMMGHQRHRSDETSIAASSTPSSSGPSPLAMSNGNGLLPGGSTDEKKLSRLWSGLRGGDRSKEKIECPAIAERFDVALDNYSKYSFAALIEYGCMIKAVSVYRKQRQYVEMEVFHRDHVGKYLDDSFTRFDHHTKAMICNNSAALYKEVGFNRKCSFFARLGVLFRLHISEGEQRSVSDYRTVYPILYRTLAGYGIADDVREVSLDTSNRGPVHMQIKALHEVYTAASRAELPDAAIRHICHLIQVYYEDMDTSLVGRLFDDLQNLVRLKGSTPILNQRISVGLGNIILPSIQLTRFPTITQPQLCSLPPHLAPTVIKANDGQPAIFIYSPFQNKKLNNTTSWVVNCPGEVSVLVYNCRPVELTVRELCLVTDGCSFEAVPVRLILPAAADGVQAARIKLIGVPRSPGRLTITGYTCEVLGLKNVCKLAATNGPLSVDVLPPLSIVKLEASLPRAPIEEDQQEPSAETTVYSGQVFEHSLTVTNVSEIAVRKARLQVWQPKVSGGPSMIEILSKGDNEDEEVTFCLEAGESREIHFRIFGIDPTATADDVDGEEKLELVETALPLASTAAEDLAGEGAHDLIPYTGRLLTCQFVVQYESEVTGDDGEVFERSSRLPLAVCIVPALTVSAWHVLPGDGPFSRYIVVDVTNSTEHDAELVYSSTRRMNVLPKETCRVPLLSPCCSDVAGRAFYSANQKDSHMMQRMEVERLRRTLERHVAEHLNIRWTIPTMELDGLVPVGALLSSVSLLKQLVLPAISLDISVNRIPYLSEDDITVGIGEIVTLKVAVISSLDYDFDGVLTLDCYQEISHQLGAVDRSDNLLVIGAKKVPFVVPKTSIRSSLPAPRCEVTFRLMFRVEGIHKLRPLIVSRNAAESLLADEVFVSPIGFNVTTKNH